MKFLSPAKINLYLEITAKRADGYHSLRTIMQTVSLYDVLEVELLPRKIEFICEHPGLAKEKNNLVLRAIDALQKFNQKKEVITPMLHRGNHLKGAKIILKKNIPLASGLGGGSGNAATVLKVLNKLWGFDLSERKLMQIAESLGADVPFFLRGGYAYVQGKGEEVGFYSYLPEYYVILVNPGLLISTAEVYAQFDQMKLTEKINFNKMGNVKSYWGKLHTPEEIAKNLFNHLEKVVLPKYQEVEEIKNILLSSGVLGSLMSGSGSTVFGIVPNEKEGKQIVKKLKKYSWQTWLVRTIGASPRW